MQRHKKKRKLVKFWVYSLSSKKPLKVALAVGEVVDLCHYEKTDEGYDRGGVSYTRNDKNEIEVTIDNVGTDCDGFYSSSYRGTIDFTRGYRGLRMTQLHGNYPRYRTPRIKWAYD